jgi:hypothetical protein
MLYFALGFLTGWVLFKRPEWANKVIATVAEKARTGIFKF